MPLGRAPDLRAEREEWERCRGPKRSAREEPALACDLLEVVALSIETGGVVGQILAEIRHELSLRDFHGTPCGGTTACRVPTQKWTQIGVAKGYG